MDAETEAKLVSLVSLHQRGILDSDELRAAKKDVLTSWSRTADDQQRVASGLPTYGPTGLPVGFNGVAEANGPIMIGGGSSSVATRQQLQLAPPPAQQTLALTVAGPSPAQLAVQQQVQALQAAQQQMEEQMQAQMQAQQQQMRQQMEAAQAALVAAAPASTSRGSRRATHTNHLFHRKLVPYHLRLIFLS